MKIRYPLGPEKTITRGLADDVVGGISSYRVCQLFIKEKRAKLRTRRAMSLTMCADDKCDDGNAEEKKNLFPNRHIFCCEIRKCLRTFTTME